jgi:dihydroorotate dehydrogenase electron transfer subunit
MYLMTRPFFHGRVRVFANRLLARDTFLVRLDAQVLATAIRPGQFLMLRLPNGTDPLLGRPFALYDTVLDESGRPVALDVVYLVVGKMTSRLAQVQAGEFIEVWGPLGNGFPEPTGATSAATDRQVETLPHVGLVAGGIGQTPFLAHIRELLGERGYGGTPAQRRARSVSLFYGVRTAELAAGVEDFRRAGAEVHLASNDGSLGFHGLVPQVLEQQQPFPAHLFGCGPEPMLRALAELARRRAVPCHLSLETPMACGIGICFSCVASVRTEAGWDYKRVCVDGPVFDAACLYE